VYFANAFGNRICICLWCCPSWTHRSKGQIAAWCNTSTDVLQCCRCQRNTFGHKSASSWFRSRPCTYVVYMCVMSIVLTTPTSNICICIHIYIYICICVYIAICMYRWIDEKMYTCICIYEYMYICTYEYIWTYAYMYICILCIYMHICTLCMHYVYIYIYTYIYIYIYMHIMKEIQTQTVCFNCHYLPTACLPPYSCHVSG